MYSLNLQNNRIALRDIKIHHLHHILKWYNDDGFQFATGMEVPVSLEMLMRKYAEVAVCSNEFFAGIYIHQGETMVGLLKGTLAYRSKDTAWINSIIIDKAYQNMGIGTQSMHLLLEYLRNTKSIQKVYLAVVEENMTGRRFWESLGFDGVRRIENYLVLGQQKQDVIVMRKRLQFM